MSLCSEGSAKRSKSSTPRSGPVWEPKSLPMKKMSIAGPAASNIRSLTEQ